MHRESPNNDLAKDSLYVDGEWAWNVLTVEHCNLDTMGTAQVTHSHTHPYTHTPSECFELLTNIPWCHKNTQKEQILL